MVELLVANGNDVNTKDRGGYTPLLLAFWHSNKNVAELLIARGTDVNAKDKKRRTVFSLAKEKGHTKIVELLRKHDAKE